MVLNILVFEKNALLRFVFSRIDLLRSEFLTSYWIIDKIHHFDSKAPRCAAGAAPFEYG